jgi:hypothetical protein
MGRFETEWLATDANLAALTGLSGAWIDQVHARRPPDGIILDMDSSESPTHGEQEGSAWNGYFGCISDMTATPSVSASPQGEVRPRSLLGSLDGSVRGYRRAEKQRGAPLCDLISNNVFVSLIYLDNFLNPTGDVLRKQGAYASKRHGPLPSKDSGTIVVFSV